MALPIKHSEVRVLQAPRGGAEADPGGWAQCGEAFGLHRGLSGF